MLNHYNVTEARTQQFASPMPLRRVAHGILSAPFRLAANATTRLSKALAPWVVMWRFLEGLDRRSLAFHSDVKGRADPNTRAKNGGIMRTGAATTDTNARRSIMHILPSRQPLEAEGERPTVIGLHTGAGTPDEWRPLAERLRFRNRVLAPHLRGYAASRASGTGEPFTLDAETPPIEPLLDAFPGPVYLAGHGYGAAVALKLALARRERIGALVLYEPTLFSLLLADPGSRYAYMDIAELRRVLGRYLDAGDWFRAALRYVDHCSGAGVWQGLSVQERATIAHRMPALCAQLDAELSDPTPLAGYAGIDVPVSLLSGARPRACTRRIAQLLARTLPRAEWRQLDGVGHSPGAHPEEVDREIERFLAQRHASWHRDPEPTAFHALPVFAHRGGGPDRADAASREESRALPSTPLRAPWNCAWHRARG